MGQEMLIDTDEYREALAAARREGALEMLDKIRECFRREVGIYIPNNDDVSNFTSTEIIAEIDILREEVKNGKVVT